MGPKKKGKQNKLARMSDDERMRYLQHKAAMEEETRRRKQQLIATFLKNKIKQEEAFARLNQAKINEQWRHLLRQAKCKELQQRLQVSRQLFEHILMRKEQIILGLQDNLQESESQYLFILQSHMEAVDRILSMGSCRVSEYTERYKKQESKILTISHQESHKETERNKYAQQLLLTVIFATQESITTTQCKMRKDAQTIRTEISNAYVDEIQSLQTRLGKHLWILQDELRNVFQSYTLSTQDQRRMYEEMKERDSENIDAVAKHSDLITNLEAEVEKLQSQLNVMGSGNTPRTSKLQIQEKQLFAVCWRKRKQNQEQAKMNEIKLKFLTTASSKAIEKLEQIKHNGENIIKIAQLCNRLETMEEKIVQQHPFLGQEQISTETSADSSANTETLIHAPNKMEHFWRRHSQGLLSRAALRMHHDTLLKENQQLRASLRHYLVTAASNSSVNLVSGNAPILMTRRIRGRRISLVPLTSEPVPPRSSVCIEAAVAIKNILK